MKEEWNYKEHDNKQDSSLEKIVGPSRASSNKARPHYYLFMLQKSQHKDTDQEIQTQILL